MRWALYLLIGAAVQSWYSIARGVSREGLEVPVCFTKLSCQDIATSREPRFTSIATASPAQRSICYSDPLSIKMFKENCIRHVCNSDKVHCYKMVFTEKRNYGKRMTQTLPLIVLPKICGHGNRISNVKRSCCVFPLGLEVGTGKEGRS